MVFIRYTGKHEYQGDRSNGRLNEECQRRGSKLLEGRGPVPDPTEIKQKCAAPSRDTEAKSNYAPRHQLARALVTLIVGYPPEIFVAYTAVATVRVKIESKTCAPIT